MGSGALWWLCLSALGPQLVCLRGQSAGVDALSYGLDRCEIFQNSTCEKCEKGWSGPFCTRENIAYVRAARLRSTNDENVENCGRIRKKKTLQLSSLTNDMMIDIHLKNDTTLEQAQKKLNTCSVADCGEKVWASDVVLRWKCMASAQRNPEILTVLCNDKGTVSICEIRVYQCTEGWWDLENGCNQPCFCQDGENCDPWNGKCPSEKAPKAPASSTSPGAERDKAPTSSTSPEAEGDKAPASSTSPEAERDAPFYLALAVGSSVALGVVVIVDVIFVIWLWRRQWKLPCADMDNHADSTAQPETASDDYLEPVSRPVDITGPYESLQMADVGQRSVYSVNPGPRHPARAKGPPLQQGATYENTRAAKK